MKPSRYISKLFFPEVCEYCKKTIPFSDSGCLFCESKDLRIPDGFCLDCNSRKCVCSKDSEKLRHLTAPFLYSGVIRKAIALFKFRKEKNYADFLCDEMFRKIVEDFSDTDFDLITFVPMTKAAKRRRGYNQSELLSHKLSKRLFIPEKELLIKTKDTLNQHRLSSEKRKENIRDAFSLKDGADIKGKTVLLCDDIKTTGSTLLACEKALLDGGARDVYCAVIAVPVYGKAASQLDKEDKNI